ncbi:hypothetical protein NL676_033638 [Syzygium grande]|nr:hypothetical protein NL676_033638 [Syzygium grande]
MTRRASVTTERGGSAVTSSSRSVWEEAVRRKGVLAPGWLGWKLGLTEGERSSAVMIIDRGRRHLSTAE